MNTTSYQQAPPYSSYGNSKDSMPNGASSAYAVAMAASTRQYPPPGHTARTHSSHHGDIESRKMYSRTQSPQEIARKASTQPESASRRKSTANDSILPNLQIPSSVNNSGGSLAEFAAQITCLFWFESTDTLGTAERWSIASSPPKRLVRAAMPSSGFRKWVVTILSTTQVTQNVILLALLFIYRLKSINPTVQGKVGSEYRLLTVALMLGNKFLDDNTYTNKTWAEVSGISVGEIHVMEVEFLSNMRYSLLASAEQWEEWQSKLGRFSDYFERSSKLPLTLPSPVAPLHLLPPASSSSNLPSPPSSMQASPPIISAYSPNLTAYNQMGHKPQWAPTSSTSLPSLPEMDLHQQSRKRSLDDTSQDVTPKRVARSTPFQAHSDSGNLQPRQPIPRLPVPHLTISTTQPSSATFPPTTPLYVNSVPLLPPPSSRSMSTVFAPSTPSWTPQLPMPNAMGPTVGHSHTTPTHSHSHNQALPNAATPSRRHSPNSSKNLHDLLALGSSPVSATFPPPSASGSVSNMSLNSPSVFLQQRSSPYRPVRHVNTLLYPPPSASMSMHAGPLGGMGQGMGNGQMQMQMHYRPLGKRNDYRTGVVPDYMGGHGLGAGQSHGHTPMQNQGPQSSNLGWNVLPQPNFRS